MKIEQKGNYPGPEGFWEQSPQLIEMQGDLSGFWAQLEAVSKFPSGELSQRKPGEIIAIRRVFSEYECYKIFPLGNVPQITERYPKKPYVIIPETHRDSSQAQIMLYIQKWPSGYNISGGPLVEDFDWVHFSQLGEEDYALVPENIRNEGVRLLALKMMNAPQKDEGTVTQEQEILDMVKRAE